MLHPPRQNVPKTLFLKTLVLQNIGGQSVRKKDLDFRQISV